MFVERVKNGNKYFLVGYHTQECRHNGVLDKPIKCSARNAWLGVGYYFWTELEFAHYWGEDFKKFNTGYYDIYKALLDIEKCINAVFDEEGYFFFRDKIEETIAYFKSKNLSASLEQVNRFLADNIWTQLGVQGIIYDDKPTNPRKSNRTYSEIPELYYKKRIQLVVFDSKNIHTFELFLEEQA
jgi:hypothetical protein